MQSEIRRCAVCQSTETAKDNWGHRYWYHNKPEGLKCRSCYKSEIRRCTKCQSTKTYLDRDAYPVWYYKLGGWICKNCYNSYRRIYDNPREIVFTPTGKTHYLKENPRTGVCSRCFRSKARGEIKRTAMHHTSYDPTDVLANTVELCVGCHMHIHAGIRAPEIRSRRCVICQSTKTTLSNGYAAWFHKPDKPEEWICRNCYERIYRYPQRPKRIRFRKDHQ